MNTSMEECGFAIDRVDRHHCEVSNEKDLRNVIPIRIDFSEEAVQIMVDRIPEAYEWLTSDLQDDQTMSKTIETLLRSCILTEYYGDSKTILRYFDLQGSEIMTLRFTKGLMFLRSKTKSRLYLPICGTTTFNR